MTCAVSADLSDPVADLDFVQAPELADLASGYRFAPRRGPALEDSDGCHFVFEVDAEPQPVAGAYCSREHPNVGDLLATDGAFDLEDAARDGPVSIARGARQQFGDASHQWPDACSGDRGTKEDRMHKGASEPPVPLGVVGRERLPRPGRTRPECRRHARRALQPAGPGTRRRRRPMA